MRRANALRLCLVIDDEAVAAGIVSSFAPQDEVHRFSLSTIVDSGGSPSVKLDEITEFARSCDAVLVEWDLFQAPLLGILSYRIHSIPPPLIALCPSAQEAQIAALIVGADRVLVPEFRRELLVAQINAHLRALSSFLGQELESRDRLPTGPSAGGPQKRLTVGPLRLDLVGHRFFIHDQEVSITPRQFALMAYFMTNEDRVVSREKILVDVWGINFQTGTNMIDVYVHFLRRVLRAQGVPSALHTVRGKGYRLSVS